MDLPSITVDSVLQRPVDQFTLDFLQNNYQLSEENGILLSPIAILLTYTMLLLGANGTTARQIKSILRLESISDDVAKIRDEFIKVIQQLDRADENITLKIFNKMVINQDSLVKLTYENTLKAFMASIDRENFKMGAQLMKKLNTWISNKTNHLISEFFEEPLGQDNILVLLNVLYFKGSWRIPFSEYRTSQELFQNLDGTTSTVDTMSLRGKTFAYSNYKNENLKIIKLPYRGDVSMLIMMPTLANSLEKLVIGLTEEKIRNYRRDLKSTELDEVKIPKFQLESDNDLVTILTSMGLHLPFSNSAELSGIADGPIKVSKSIQRVVFKIDEQGTEAAAATSIALSRGMEIVVAEESFVLDRPFLFFLYKDDFPINLFAGVVRKL